MQVVTVPLMRLFELTKNFKPPHPPLKKK